MAFKGTEVFVRVSLHNIIIYLSLSSKYIINEYFKVRVIHLLTVGPVGDIVVLDLFFRIGLLWILIWLNIAQCRLS